MRRILEKFGERFGRVLGKVWRVLASLGPLFCVFFVVLAFGMLSNRGPRGSWAGFWFHFQGFGRGQGLEGPKLRFSWTAFFDFVFWLLVLLEVFGSKAICLKHEMHDIEEKSIR